MLGERIKTSICKYNTYIVLSFFIAIYVELFFETRNRYISIAGYGLLDEVFSARLFLKLVLFFALFLIVFLLIDKFKYVFIYIDKYRYIIGLAFVIVCVVFEFSGSSIASAHNYLGNAYKDKNDLISDGVLLGIPREIRTDEWSVLTPFNFSQQYNDYNAVSSIIRGTETDVTTFYATPSWSLATLFRPFLWGYMVFGASKGLAFYWSLRTVCLFLVTYEFGKLITRNKKVFSVALAALVTFSQTIQWWYSTNGLIEMFIFGQLAVVLLYHFINAQSLAKKILICFGIVECAGGYMLAYYPAQQVPLAYVFGATAIYVIITERKKIKKSDILLFLLTLVAFGILAILLLRNSWNAIEMTRSTVYPGKREDKGGDTKLWQLFYYVINIFVPVDNDIIIVNSNASESAVFYSLFPIGIIGSIITMIRSKKGDILSVFLIIIETLFFVFAVIGLPGFLAKVTFLSFSISSRIMEVIGYLDIILLFRFLSLDKRRTCDIKKKVMVFEGIVTLLAIAGITVLLLIHHVKTITIIWVCAIGIWIWILYLIINGGNANKEKLAITLICVVSFSGLCVNPLQQGTNVLYKNNVIDSVAGIVRDKPDSRWIVVSDYNQINNLPLTVGAKTINSTNIYPNIEMWKEIDLEGKYYDIYNRYANIQVELTDEKSSFILKAPDSIDAIINYDDLDKLNVEYILSDKRLDNSRCNLVKMVDNKYIYSVAQ